MNGNQLYFIWFQLDIALYKAEMAVIFISQNNMTIHLE